MMTRPLLGSSLPPEDPMWSEPARGVLEIRLLTAECRPLTGEEVVTMDALDGVEAAGPMGNLSETGVSLEDVPLDWSEPDPWNPE